MDSNPTSFAHALFLARRAEFLVTLEQFLVSRETPEASRATEAERTDEQVRALIERLMAEGFI